MSIKIGGLIKLRNPVERDISQTEFGMKTFDVLSKTISGVNTSSGLIFVYNFTGFTGSPQQQGKMQPKCIREAHKKLVSLVLLKKSII